ncbi:glycosyltransferase family 61 protein [Alteromonas sp. 1_MG-2023]|uniref:glycosyltransferase family 61 protein n=1 Tax=Alteromonas sp. 1_MG-2023 TaxID=3062669 RepID=UPI0026E2CB7C|nr:glycosyltransferase family 61 protein [Alteromonas sp. 1_MG-2023]MDO6567908.1 glycosyltransferase family 61 protein [Alteromonas sp. 1_MG-2023]
MKNYRDIASLFAKQLVEIVPKKKNFNDSIASQGKVLADDIISRVKGVPSVFDFSDESWRGMTGFLRDYENELFRFSDKYHSSITLSERVTNDLAGKMEFPSGIIPAAFNPTRKTIPKLNIHTLHNVSIVFSGRHFAILDTKSKKFFSGSTLLPSESNIKYKKPVEVKELTFCGDFRGQNNICHFAYDSFPRALISRDVIGDLPVLFNPPNTFGKYQKMLCDKAGIRVLNFDQTCIVNVKKMHFFDNLIPQKMCHPALLCHPIYIKNLSSVKPFSNGNRIKLYISRRDAKSRQILNEIELEKALTLLGFKIVIPTEHSPEEQLQLFADADIVIGSHGAGLTGVFACKSGSKVIEIFNPSKGTAAYANMSQAMGLNYTAVFGSPVKDAKNNFTVDVSEITKLVELDFE